MRGFTTPSLCTLAIFVVLALVMYVAIGVLDGIGVNVKDDLPCSGPLKQRLPKALIIGTKKCGTGRVEYVIK